MSRKLLFFLVLFLPLIPADAQWTSIATDIAGDGNLGALLDGRELEYRYDVAKDSLWFRITVEDFNSTTAGNLGVNVMVNIPGAGTPFTFWGADNLNPYHKLLTVWVTGSPSTGYTGTVGVSDSTGVATTTYNNLHSNNVTIQVDTVANTISLGVERQKFITDAEMGGTSITVATAAAVGSSLAWNDDIYEAAGMMTINTVMAGIGDFDRTDIQLYPNPADDRIVISGTDLETRQVELFDLLGNEIFSIDYGQPVRGDLELDVSTVQPGIYFLHWTSQRQEQTLRLVID